MDAQVVKGNRLVFAGAVLYLLEWVAIVAAGGIGVFLDPETAPAKLAHAYAGHENWYAWAAGWFAVVLLGRVLFAVALRRGMVAASPTGEIVAEFAVLAMLAGVVIEAASYAVVMAGAVMTDHHGAAESVRTLDVLGHSLNSVMWGPSGLAVLCLAWVMWRHGGFPRVLPGLGLLGGALLLLSAMAFNAPRFASVAGALEAGATVFWVWMIWTAVLMWRRTPKVTTA